MSRTLKRVPLSFDWPLGKTWGGYLNPYYQLATECPDCEAGYDRAGGRPDANAALFYAQWYGKAPFDWYKYGAKSPPLTQEHPAYKLATYNVEKAPEFYMTAAEKGMREAFRRGAVEGFPHDEPLVAFPSYKKLPAIEAEAQRLHAMWREQWAHQLIQADVDALIADGQLVPNTTADEANDLSYNSFSGGNWMHTCVEARCAREGVPFTCTRCAGTATLWPSPEIEQQCESWVETDPPTGDGYQLWQTTSEGSPISPVFDTLDKLCAWAAVNATTFGSLTATAEEWKKMLEEDLVYARDGQGVYL